MKCFQKFGERIGTVLWCIASECFVESNENTASRNKFEAGMISILAVVALRKSSANIRHTIYCYIIMPEDVKSLVGLRHEQLSFVKQATTFDCSNRISVD